MTRSSPLLAGYEDQLEQLWKDRINLPAQSSARLETGAKLDLLRYAIAETEAESARLQKSLKASEEARQELLSLLARSDSERMRLVSDLEAIRSATEALQRMLADNERERAEIQAMADREREMLQSAWSRARLVEEVLTKNLRKPWLPLKDAINRRLAYVAARIAKPFSEYRAIRFRNSAQKRNPRRYLSPPEPTLHVNTATTASASLSHDAQTQAILARYFPPAWQEPTQPLHLQVGSASLARARLAAAPKAAIGPHSGPHGFSIVTPFFAHLEYFSACARSVAAIAETSAETFEWVVVNDDPSIPDDSLWRAIPGTLRSRVRLIADGRNHGIARALDRGIAAAAHPWIVLLDCDDMLASNALDALAPCIDDNPGCRYFSSLMIDMDERGHELRRRRPDHPLADAFGAGMVGGHMVAFHRGLYNELGGFDPRFSGAQDYDFLLRAAAREQVVRIEQHLYFYRWHAKSQSVGRLERQARVGNAVRIAFLRETMQLRSMRKVRAPLRERPEIFVVIRTQGERMDLLAAAVASARAQALPTTPCIVVHGGEQTVQFVRHHLPAELGEAHAERPAVILLAAAVGLRRGHPCNVALRHLRDHAARFDLLCFVDDDDHLLPGFAERLSHLIRSTGADLAYGMTNALARQREPFVQHQLRPALSALLANFMAFNSFLVRVDAVLESGACFAEDMHYLEDHHFLVQLLGAGIHAVPLTEVVAEYRLIGDGNAEVKLDAGHFRFCQGKVLGEAKVAASRLSEMDFWDDVLAFPTQDRPPFDKSELDLMIKTRDLLAGLGVRLG